MAPRAPAPPLRAWEPANSAKYGLLICVSTTAWRGHTVNDLTNPDTCVPVSITHAGKAMLPSPSFVLETGDVVHVSATLEGVETLRKRVMEAK